MDEQEGGGAAVGYDGFAADASVRDLLDSMCEEVRDREGEGGREREGEGGREREINMEGERERGKAGRADSNPPSDMHHATSILCEPHLLSSVFNRQPGATTGAVAAQSGSSCSGTPVKK